MIITNYNQEEGILETIFEGEITVKDILDYIAISDFDKENPGVLKILSDGRNAHFNVSPAELNKIVEAAGKITSFHLYILDAMVVENPLDTAMTMLYENISPVTKYKVKVFSTIQSAREWLKNFE